MIWTILGLLASAGALAFKVWSAFTQSPVKQAAVAETRLQDTQQEVAQTSKVLNAETQMAASLANSTPAVDSLRNGTF